MNSKLVGSCELMGLLLRALKNKKPLSIVSVGITESFVLAQYTILSEEEFMAHKEAWIAAQGVKRGFDHRGIRFRTLKQGMQQ
ncbi:MAG: hypothetical protein SCK29_09930 [Bacillota bacterium]|nr:hypothetical protein [Bacillota bacterium]MDW7684419.1 hypothetical protein [Bacillota bacterium]